MKKATTLVKEIEKLSRELLDNYTRKEINEAVNEVSKKMQLSYITDNIYYDDEE